MLEMRERAYVVNRHYAARQTGNPPRVNDSKFVRSAGVVAIGSLAQPILGGGGGG